MGKQTFKWLDRRVAKLGPYLTLCLSEKELHSASKKLTHSKIEFPITGAQCSTFCSQKTGELCAIVSVSQQSQNKNSSIELAGLLIHEAVHVWQAYVENLGEVRHGDEQEAYAIQGISQELLAEYARRIT